jgi:mono/diheme cytochrome c family protein
MPKSRVVVYKLDGDATLPAYAPPAATAEPAPVKANMALLTRGERSYAESCSLCHGPDAMGTGTVPDLRRSPVVRDAGAFRAVLTGGRADLGMPDFTKWIKPDEAEAIRAYLGAQAHKLYASEHGAKSK